MKLTRWQEIKLNYALGNYDHYCFFVGFVIFFSVVATLALYDGPYSRLIPSFSIFVGTLGLIYFQVKDKRGKKKK